MVSLDTALFGSTWLIINLVSSTLNSLVLAIYALRHDSGQMALSMLYLATSMRVGDLPGLLLVVCSKIPKVQRSSILAYGRSRRWIEVEGLSPLT